MKHSKLLEFENGKPIHFKGVVTKLVTCPNCDGKNFKVVYANQITKTVTSSGVSKSAELELTGSFFDCYDCNLSIDNCSYFGYDAYIKGDD